MWGDFLTRGLSAWVCICVGCGTPAAGPQNAGRQGAVDESEPESVPSDTIEAAEDEAPDTPSEPCADLPFEACRADPGCVFDRTCRVATGPCEGLLPAQLPEGRSPQPDFGGGDPCARVNRLCAWDRSAGFCVPFVAQSACPASRAEASQAAVFCMHPDQARLHCAYSGGWCNCQRPAPYCGGAAPSPEILNQPTSWGCIDEVSPTGCPNRPIRAGTRCTIDESVQCMQGCSELYRCVRRRWRLTHLPPRP